MSVGYGLHIIFEIRNFNVELSLIFVFGETEKNERSMRLLIFI